MIINVQLTEQELDLVLMGLGKLPLEMAIQLFFKLQQIRQDSRQQPSQKVEPKVKEDSEKK